MIPSIDDRISSMITAMQQIVIPALSDANSSLAAEQAGLVLGHLVLLQGQVDHGTKFEQLQMQQDFACASAAVEAAEGGPETQQARNAIFGLVCPEPDECSPDLVRSKTRAVRRALSDLIYALREDGAPGSRAKVEAIAIDHIESASLQLRAWFSACGFEFNDISLPSIPDLMAEMDR